MAFVIGGYSDIGTGVKLQERVFVIPLRGFHMASIVVGSLIILGTVSLAIIPFIVWLAARLLKQLYEKLKKQFFMVQ